MNVYQTIANIMGESIVIGKDSTNKQQNFKYRGIDAVMNTFYPLFAKHKLFIVPEVLEQHREERTTKSGGNLIYSVLKVRYTFYAEDGSSVSATVIGEGMDSADKASNKAMAVAMKYALFQVFCIPTEEFIDPDGDSPEQSKKKSQQTARNGNESGESVSVDLPPMTYEEALTVAFMEPDGTEKYVKDLDPIRLGKLIKIDDPRYAELKEAAKLILEAKAKG